MNITLPSGYIVKINIHNQQLFGARPRLPEKEKAKWIKELKSGKHKQGGGWLNHQGKKCCLGVYCHLQNLPYDKKSCTYTFLNGAIGCRILPNNPILGEKGMFHGFRISHSNGAANNLAAMNDTGFSFADIAVIIQEVF